MYVDPSQLQMLRSAAREESIEEASAGTGDETSSQIDEDAISRALGDINVGDEEKEEEQEKENEKQEETETQNETDTLMMPGVIALKGGRNGRWCADEGHRTICNRNWIRGWEKFTVQNLDGGQIALKGG